MFLMVCKGLFYTIVVDIYTYRLVFCRISHCVLHHFTLRLASKRAAFCTKLRCVLHQIALRFAPNCTAFCGKTQRIWRIMAPKLVQIAVLCNAYSFYRHLQLTPFCIKTNLRENRFLRLGRRLVDRKGTHNVKILAENCTKVLAWHSRVWATARKARTFTTASKSGCRACRPQPTETAS